MQALQLVISWAGMRGTVTLASALALPPVFPMRDLIVFVAFSVVLGTLVIQGLTLGPLMRVLDLRDDDPVAQEPRLARERAVAAVLAALSGGLSPAMNLVRGDVKARLMFADETPRRVEPASAHAELCCVCRRRTPPRLRIAVGLGGCPTQIARSGNWQP